MSHTQITRRNVLKAAGLGLTVFADHATLALADSQTRHVLDARSGVAPITGGRLADTAIWGYNGDVPGPLLRVRQGERLNVRLNNRLDQATSIHWHGIRIDNAMDGSPLVQEPVAPGQSFDYSFVAPDAGTYWYHTHTRSFEQLERGLYGMLVVDEAEPKPGHFDDEVIVIFDDWLLRDDGQIESESFGHMMHMSHAGRMGNYGTVNGRNRPDLAVRRGARTHLRFLSTCNARIISLKLPDIPAWLMAVDGQPVKPAEQGRSIVLAPGQRFDLAMDIPLTPNARYPIGVQGRNQIYTAAWLQSDRQAALDPASNPPDALADNRLPALSSTRDNFRFSLDMQGGAMGRLRNALLDGEPMDIRSLVREGRVWAFNGVADMDRQDALFDVARGTRVEFEIANNTAWPHAMHLHGHHFRVIEHDGVPVPRGPWRDTHLMQRGERHTLGFVADNPGRWLVHCHMAEHAAAGMSGWFNVRA